MLALAFTAPEDTNADGLLDREGGEASTSPWPPTPTQETRDAFDRLVMAAGGVLASVGSTGDAYDNAMAESFVDTYRPS